MTATTTTDGMRRCIGSARYGIEPHEAPIEDFPKQPSQKDGLGRMCRPHWNQYTTALRKAAVARKAAEAGEVAPETAEAAPAAEPKTTPRVRRAKATPTEVVTG
jgi:hypothetical protein